MAGEFLDYITQDQSNKQCKFTQMFKQFSPDLEIEQGKYFGKDRFQKLLKRN